jgi:hypothetical protein
LQSNTHSLVSTEESGTTSTPLLLPFHPRELLQAQVDHSSSSPSPRRSPTLPPFAMSSHSHRATTKTANKAFKSGHASKGSLKQKAKGRLPGKESSTSHLSSAQTKLARRNTTKQLQQQKRAALVQEQRLFQGRGGVPRIVCVIELGDGTDARRCVKELAGVLGEEAEGVEVDGRGVVNLR